MVATFSKFYSKIWVGFGPNFLEKLLRGLTLSPTERA